MAQGLLSINTDEFIVATNKLEKLGRADLPVAVRSTLNEMAFRMKGSGGTRGQIDKQAEKDFDYRRNRTLFKKLTGVSKAQGLDIGRMQSESGIVNRSGMNEVAQGLADQQKGGTTKQKATPLNKSRIGSNKGKRVRKSSQLSRLKDAVRIKKKKGSEFIKLAARAHKQGRPVIITGRDGNDYVGILKGFKRQRKGLKIKIDFQYRINKSKTVNLKKKRPFVDRAAVTVMRDLPNEFARQAQRRINKSMR